MHFARTHIKKNICIKDFKMVVYMREIRVGSRDEKECKKTTKPLPKVTYSLNTWKTHKSTMKKTEFIDNFIFPVSSQNVVPGFAEAASSSSSSLRTC